jgi:GTP-binding protein
MRRVRETRAYTIAQMPAKRNFEVAFIGRSNVGKSSLINTILGYTVAQVSQKPGCTLWIGIHAYQNITLIDLPGYGYAKTHESRRNIVSDLVADYFSLRRTDLLYILIDTRRGLQEIDKNVIAGLSKYSIPIKLIGTKCDKKYTNTEEMDLSCSTKTKTGISEILADLGSISSNY